MVGGILSLGKTYRIITIALLIDNLPLSMAASTITSLNCLTRACFFRGFQIQHRNIRSRLGYAVVPSPRQLSARAPPCLPREGCETSPYCLQLKASGTGLFHFSRISCVFDSLWMAFLVGFSAFLSVGWSALS